MKKQRDALVNKYFIVYAPDSWEIENTGQVLSRVREGVYLVAFHDVATLVLAGILDIGYEALKTTDQMLGWRFHLKSDFLTAYDQYARQWLAEIREKATDDAKETAR